MSLKLRKMQVTQSLIVPNQRHILDVLNKMPKSLKCWELLYTVILSTTETFAQPPSSNRHGSEPRLRFVANPRRSLCGFGVE